MTPFCRAWALGVALAACTVWAQAPKVVFVTGDHEYRSEFSMPMIARILEAHHGMKTSVAYAKPTPQTEDNIEGLEALADADVAVFFLRWRTLPDDQLQKIIDYLHTGRPIVGIRTSTHSFNYPKGHKQERWNDGFGIDVFGQKWIRHHGHIVRMSNGVKAGLAAVWLLAAGAAAAGCSNTINGAATCPGCGVGVEPSFPTSRPSVTTTTPTPTATVVPSPGGDTLPSSGGYVYIETKSGKTRCQLTAAPWAVSRTSRIHPSSTASPPTVSR